MRLTPEQTQQVINHLTEVSPDGIVCPVCGQRHWNVMNTIIEAREFQNGNIILGGESAIVPYVSITCNRCGNSLLFNAIQLGIVQPNNNENNGRESR